MMQLSPTLDGRAAWTGQELERSGDWIRVLDDAQRQEIAAALDYAQRRGRCFPNVTRDDFPLPRTAPLLADIAEELENGRGAVRLRGLDAARYTEDELRQVFWGIGCHLGTALYQSAKGEMMGEVRDETRLATPDLRTARTRQGRVVAVAHARHRPAALAHRPLRRHRPALRAQCQGRRRQQARQHRRPSTTRSSAAGPILLELLCQDYWRSRPKDEDGAGVERAFALPVFSVLDGKITCQYSRTYVEQAQEFPEVPRLTAAQNEALDLLAAVAEETCLYSPFEPGDIQLLNNHVIFHGRTAYEDDAGTHQERLLLRLWLAVPNSRRLPADHAILWGSTQPGAVRGGVVQPATGARAVGPRSAAGQQIHHG